MKVAVPKVNSTLVQRVHVKAFKECEENLARCFPPTGGVGAACSTYGTGGSDGGGRHAFILKCDV